MKSIGSYLNEDTNQFGPGTDLMISMLAVMLVLTLITSHLYSREKRENEADGGSFRVAAEAFPAGDFHVRPVTRLVDPGGTEARVQRIVRDYRSQGYPYIFVVGHSNVVDTPDADDPRDPARWQRNWGYAGRRAALIAALIADRLRPEQRDNVVVMTTGEFDLRDPADPGSHENAWVEVVFGRSWKLPSRRTPD